MMSDSDILKDLVAELKTEPSLRDDDIAVGVRDGLATLAGFGGSYADKWRAERIAGKGTVRSYAELKDIERAVRNAPGITEVENHLTVDPNVFTSV